MRIVSKEGSLPLAFAPHARGPSSGSIMMCPNDLRVLQLFCTAGLSHILGFIAGANIISLLKHKIAVDKASSAMPQLAFANILAVAGTIAKHCAQSVNSM